METAGGQEAFDAAVTAMLDDAGGWRLTSRSSAPARPSGGVARCTESDCTWPGRGAELSWAAPGSSRGNHQESRRDMGDDWRTSSYSGSNGSCVETASSPGVILVRDTTNRDGGILAFAADVWRAFAAELKQL
ncbi:MAG: DUF397 domain-containing protein [Trebonia sp.]